MERVRPYVTTVLFVLRTRTGTGTGTGLLGSCLRLSSLTITFQRIGSNKCLKKKKKNLMCFKYFTSVVSSRGQQLTVNDVVYL